MMRQSNLEKIRNDGDSQPQHTINSYQELLTLFLGGPPNPTQQSFIDDHHRYKAFMGAAGSAKTTAGCASIFLRGLFAPNSKWAICRYDYNKLINTTYQTFQSMLSRLPKGLLLDRDKSPPMRMWFQPINGGEPFQITWMGLKDQLGGIELDGAFVDEADDVETRRILELDSRLRSKSIAEKQLMLAFNPPDTIHDLYTLCTGFNYKHEKLREPLFKLYTPKYKENAHNLPANYYERLEESLPSDMADRLVRGQWGTSFTGTPAIPQFKPKIHSRDLQYSPYDTLLRFWDFGFRHPFCLFAQVDQNGRLLILRELMGSSIEITPFITLCKTATNKFFPNLRRGIEDYGDIAVKQRKDTGSALAILAKAGIQMRYQSMRVHLSIRALRHKFEQLIEGEPAIQIDATHCPVLTRALSGGYRMKDDGTEPFKDGFYDHPVDTLRYGVIGVFGMADNGYRPSGIGDLSGIHSQSLEYDRSMDPGVNGVGHSAPRTVESFFSFERMGRK